MVSGSGLVAAALGGLAAAGAGTLSATARVELEKALAAKAKQSQNLLHGRKSVWKGPVSGWRHGKVMIEFVPTRLSTFGVSDGYGTFKDFSVTALAGHSDERLTGGFFAHRQRFPVQLPGEAVMPAGSPHTPLTTFVWTRKMGSGGR